MKTPFWFHSINLISIALLPAALIYFFVSKIVFIFRLFHQKSSKTPVICVGGILAGGVGKTPIVAEIAKYFKTPVIMRGYKGKNLPEGRSIKSTDSAYDVGDEAKMLSSDGLEVYVGNRKNNIDVINYKENKPLAIVMDDGFQNPTIKKNISIVVFDEAVGVQNGMLIPSGPMRETLYSGIKRCDAVIINQSDIGAHSTNILKVAKKYKKAVFFAKREMETAGFFGKYVAFSGIGYPEKFFDSLREIVSMRIVSKVPFPDHHFYTKDDIIRLFRIAKKYEARLVCTEKDWIKLPKHIQTKVKYIPLKTNIQSNFYMWLEKKIKKD